MEANILYNEGRELTYAEFPPHFFYKQDTYEWCPRKKGQSIRRLQYVPLRNWRVILHETFVDSSKRVYKLSKFKNC